MNEPADDRVVVDYQETTLSIGHHVTYYDEEEGRFFTAVVKQIGASQAVLGTIEALDSKVEFTLIKGQRTWPDGPNGAERLRFNTLAVVPTS